MTTPVVIHPGVFPEQQSGATSTSPRGILDVPVNSSVTIYPTSAGTATVYISTSPFNACQADINANNFSTGSAKWQAWTSGAVAALTSEVVFGKLSAVAVVPASGTWTLEVCR